MYHVKNTKIDYLLQSVSLLGLLSSKGFRDCISLKHKVQNDADVHRRSNIESILVIFINRREPVWFDYNFNILSFFIDFYKDQKISLKQNYKSLYLDGKNI